MTAQEVRFLGHNSGVAYRIDTSTGERLLLKIHVPQGGRRIPGASGHPGRSSMAGLPGAVHRHTCADTAAGPDRGALAHLVGEGPTGSLLASELDQRTTR